MMRYLGLDLGTASLGWCLVEWNRDNRTGQVVDAGVRIFPETLEGTNESNKKPKNVSRREYRMRRRQTARGSLKRQNMRELLHGMGLAPSANPDVFNRSDKGRKPTDIYVLRKRAVSKRLDEYSLGRVFMHLLNHRGFIGSPKEDAELEALESGEQVELADEKREKLKESKKLKDDIDLFNQEIRSRILGAVLAEKDSQRGHPISNKMILAEFDKIWAEQRKHHPDILNDEIREELKRQLKFRRPIFWRLKSLGKCEYAPDSPLLMKADWYAQQYMMLQTLNNIRLEDGNKRRLDAEEWQIIRNLMMSKREVTFTQMRKALAELWEKNGTEKNTKFNFEVGADAKKHLKGNATEALIRAVLGENFEQHSALQVMKDKLAQMKWSIKYGQVKKAWRGSKGKHKSSHIEILDFETIEENKNQFRTQCREAWGLTDVQADQLINASLPEGWTRLSEKVIQTILPDLEKANNDDRERENDFATVLEHHFPRGKEYEPLDRLPSHPRHLPDVRNPTVIRCLNEVRKVVNNIIGTEEKPAYGKPDYIRIELARDVKLAGKKKREALAINKKNRKAREDAKKYLQENSIPVNDMNIIKHQLWEESGHKCLYSGLPISCDDLFRNNQFQIEHINPFSRSWDNSFNNLLLCEEELNRMKGNRTPFEAFGYSDKWDNMAKWVKDAKLPKAKERRFLSKNYRKDFDDEMASRELSDTAYAARVAREFLACLYPPEEALLWKKGREPRVQAVGGRVTSLTGQIWGLYKHFNRRFIDGNDSVAKIREDQRHHALDAFVIAVSSVTNVTLLAQQFNRMREDEKLPYEAIKAKLFIPFPWPGFHQDILSRLERVIVSYRVDAKTTGALTDDTHLGKLKDGTLVKRVSLSKNIKPEQIRSIIDKTVKEKVWQHLLKFDDEQKMPQTWCERPSGKEKKAKNKCIEDVIKKAFADDANFPEMPNRKGMPNPIKKLRIEVKQDEHLTVSVRTPVNEKQGSAVVLKGDNHHIALYEDGTDKKGKKKYLPVAVSKLEAQRRIAKGLSAVSPEYNGQTLVTHWCKQDMFERTDPKTGEITYWRVTVLGEKQTTLVPHNQVSGGKAFTNHFLLRDGFKKITVDPIGRIRPAK